MQYFSKPQEHAVEPPSLEPEDSWPSRNRVAIRDINRAHELTTQLQAVLLQLPAGSTWSQVGGDIIKDILKLTASALSALQSSGALADQKRKEPDGRKRSRRKEEKWEVVTTVPYEDGHLWRKYGQKAINNAEHPRSYFRCTYKEEQGCEAKKTVQQEDGHADPPKFSVEYTIRHTCKLSESASFFPFQKPSDLTPISGLTSSSSTSSSPSLAEPAAGSAKGDDQSPENGISNGDLDLPQEGTQVPDEMLDDWDRLLDDLELDMLFGDDDCHEWH